MSESSDRKKRSKAYEGSNFAHASITGLLLNILQTLEEIRDARASRDANAKGEGHGEK